MHEEGHPYRSKGSEEPGPTNSYPAASAGNSNHRVVAVVVGPVPPPYMGPAIGTLVVTRALRELGVEVVHLNTQDRRSVFTTGVLDVTNVIHALWAALRLAVMAMTRRPRFVYVPISQNRWGFARDALLIGIARAFRREIVIHLRGSALQSFYARSPGWERFLIRRACGSARVAIALTPSLTPVYEGLVDAARVRILENAVDDPWQERAGAVVEARRRGRDGVGVLYIANDFATKGARTLLEAFARANLPTSTLRMVGAPPDAVRDALRARAAELGVSDRLEIPGERVGAKKNLELADADLFAYPTENDGQPLVVIEAMAAGLPIIASRFAGIPDTLAGAGVLVEPGDVDGLADALTLLGADPDRRQALGRAARARYETHYTPEAYRQRLAECLEGLLDPRGRD